MFGRQYSGQWTEQSVSIVPVTGGTLSHFCGFHDIRPWSPSGKYLLALETEESERLPGADDKATVGIVDLAQNSQEFIPIAETFAWNWHVGSRQQWLGDDRIIYNDTRDGQHVAVIRDIGSDSETVINCGVWTISPDRRWGIAPSFARLRQYYDKYGFAGGTAPSLSDHAPADDGLYLVDLEAGTTKLLFSIAEIASSRYGDGPEAPRGPFWITHPTFNPDGSGFTFYLRRRLADGYLYSDFFYADRDGKSVKFLLNDLVSHYDWLDPSHVVIWTRQNRMLSNFRQGAVLKNSAIMGLFKGIRKFKRRMGGKFKAGSFRLVNVHTGEHSSFGGQVLEQDGHNMFSPDRKWMICDTYPSKSSERTLYLFHLESGKRVDVGRLPTTQRLLDSPASCDLHPRWNGTGTEVCVDSAQGDTRQIYVANVEEVVSG